MARKTEQEYEQEIRELSHDKKTREEFEKERKKSDDLYAIKLIEKIVFAIISLMGLAVVGALIKLVLLQPK